MITDSESKEKSIVLFGGQPYKKQVMLADVNIPYKFSIDRNNKNLFFCINADEFSDQSFHSVIMNLDTGSSSVIPGIRNGFASAVDTFTSTVYLGGSDGIYIFNYNTNAVQKPALISGIDIFDMYFHYYLYFVDTASQNLNVYKNAKKITIPQVKDCMTHHFVFDKNDNLIFISSSGIHVLPKGSSTPKLLERVARDLNFRGITTDTLGRPYIIAQDGIYAFDDKIEELIKLFSVENGYGLAFDKDNNIVYSDERTVNRLTPLVC